MFLLHLSPGRHDRSQPTNTFSLSLSLFLEMSVAQKRRSIQEMLVLVICLRSKNAVRSTIFARVLLWPLALFSLDPVRQALDVRKSN